MPSCYLLRAFGLIREVQLGYSQRTASSWRKHVMVCAMTSEEILEIIVRRKEAGETWSAIGREVGLSRQTVRERYKKWDRGEIDLPDSKLDELEREFEEEELIFHDKKKPDQVGWQELVELASSVQNMEERLSDEQEYAEVTINHDGPAIILFTGDWHLGATGTNYSAWAEQMKKTIETPGLYMVNLGDSRQNADTFRNLSVVLSQVLSPKQQARMFRAIVNDLTDNDKLLATIIGNHDEFEERSFGQRLQNYLMDKAKCPHFPNRGLLKLTLGDVDYNILVLHKTRYRSMLNDTHGVLREYERDFPADIVAGAHDHKPAAQIIYRNVRAYKHGYGFGGQVVLLTIGTFQEKSAYGYKFFHNGSLPVFWYVVLDNKEKCISVPMNRLQDALVMREAWKRN